MITVCCQSERVLYSVDQEQNSFHLQEEQNQVQITQTLIDNEFSNMTSKGIDYSDICMIL